MNNTAKFLMFYAFFMSLASVGAGSKLSAQSTAKFKDLKLDNPTEMVIRKEIVGGGIDKILLPSTQYVEGVSDWDKSTLPDYVNLLFSRIRFGYATHADAGKEAELEYNDNVPAILLNSRLVIKQSGRTVFNKPISSITNNFVETTLDDFYAETGAIRYITDGTPVDMYIEFPAGKNLGTATKHYVYIGLDGFTTKLG